MSDFYKYFKENMQSLNLPAPEGDSLLLLVASIAMAALAWAFWTFVGNDGFSAVML